MCVPYVCILQFRAYIESMLEFPAYCIYHIYYFWKHFFIALAAYWSPFVTNMLKRFINLFFVVVV